MYLCTHTIHLSLSLWFTAEPSRHRPRLYRGQLDTHTYNIYIYTYMHPHLTKPLIESISFRRASAPPAAAPPSSTRYTHILYIYLFMYMHTRVHLSLALSHDLLRSAEPPRHRPRLHHRQLDRGHRAPVQPRQGRGAAGRGGRLGRHDPRPARLGCGQGLLQDHGD